MFSSPSDDEKDEDLVTALYRWKNSGEQMPDDVREYLAIAAEEITRRKSRRRSIERNR